MRDKIINRSAKVVSMIGQIKKNDAKKRDTG